MNDIATLLTDPTAWIALLTIFIMEVVLGIDNLIFISILANKLPEEQRNKARRIGISLALLMRLGLLSVIAWLVGLTQIVIDLDFTGAPGSNGEPSYETAFSWRDLILIFGGLFLVWKATNEIHHNMEPSVAEKNVAGRVAANFGAVIVQILLLDLVFSIDSILTAVGMTDELPIMFAAVIAAVAVMLFAAEPLGTFIGKNPTVIMLALGFLLMIGAVLIADGFGVHVPKGYIYTAMAFSAGVETLNVLARRRRQRAQAKMP